MTTFQLREDQAIADALTDAIAFASPDAITGLTEMRSASLPGNGYHLAHVSWAEREPVARALRAAAADGHPMAVQLQNLADQLEESLRARMANS